MKASKRNRYEIKAAMTNPEHFEPLLNDEILFNSLYLNPKKDENVNLNTIKSNNFHLQGFKMSKEEFNHDTLEETTETTLEKTNEKTHLQVQEVQVDCDVQKCNFYEIRIISIKE